MTLRAKKPPEPPPGAPMWVLTYSDLVSLLLTFFILLLAQSKTDTHKAKEVLTSIRVALGVSGQDIVALRMAQSGILPSGVTYRIERVARELRTKLQIRGMDKKVRVEYDGKGGLRINLPSQVLFDSARAELKPEAQPVLTDVAQVLAGLTGAAIEVRGHTDSRPLTHTAVYKDNYDLSYARAKSVTVYLNESGGVSMDVCEIVALGPSQPSATNDTEEGRQVNRRVEIYVRGEGEGETLKPVSDQLRTMGITEPAAAPDNKGSVKYDGG